LSQQADEAKIWGRERAENGTERGVEGREKLYFVWESYSVTNVLSSIVTFLMFKEQIRKLL
jgi:hypothetical protein